MDHVICPNVSVYALFGYRRPPHSDHYGVFFRLPGVIDSGSPHRVVTLSFHVHSADRQVNAEPATHEQYEGRPRFFTDPLRPTIAGWVYTPLDLQVGGGADVVGWLDEVA